MFFDFDGIWGNILELKIIDWLHTKVRNLFRNDARKRNALIYSALRQIKCLYRMSLLYQEHFPSCLIIG